MKTFSILTLLASLVAFGNHANARSQDTVAYRLVTTYLMDSSLIRYEIGSVGHINAGDTAYLTFADTAPLTIATVWQTTNFNVATPDDSVTICRFASIDNQHEIVDTIGYSTGIDTAMLKAFVNDCRHRYYDTNFYIAPASSAFNSFSSILYVVQVRKASDNSLLLTLDSTICFLDDTGHLVWACSGDARVRGFSLSAITPGTAVYLTAMRTVFLPPGDSIQGDQLTAKALNPPAIYGDSTWLGQEVSWSLVPALKPSIVTGKPELSIIEYSDAKDIKLSLSLPPGMIRVTLSDATGRILKNIECETPGGNYELPINCGNLADGCYFITVEGNLIGPLRADFIIPSPLTSSAISASYGVPFQAVGQVVSNSFLKILPERFLSNPKEAEPAFTGPIFGLVKGTFYIYDMDGSGIMGFMYLPDERLFGNGNLYGGTAVGCMYTQLQYDPTGGTNIGIPGVENTGIQECSLISGP